MTDPPTANDSLGSTQIADPSAPGTVESTRYGPTPSARRRAWLLAGVTVGAILVGVAAVSYAIAGHVPDIAFGIAAVAAVTVVLGTRGAGRSTSLTVSPGKVVYASRIFTITSSWTNVEGLVRLGRKPTSLGLRLSEPAITKEMRAPLGAAWRRTLYPYERTIPLEIFLSSTEDDPLLAQLRAVAPALFDSEPQVDRRPTVQLKDRFLGVIAGLVPATVIAVGSGLILFPPPLTRATSTYFIVETVALAAFVVLRLRHWQPGTGERAVDFIGRVLVAPRSGEHRSQALRQLATLSAAMVVIVGFGYGIGRAYAGTGSVAAAPCQPYRAVSGAPTPPAWPGDAPADITIAFGPNWATVPLTEAGLASFEQANDFTDPTGLTASVERSITGGMVQMALRNTDGPVTVARLLDFACPKVTSVSDLEGHIYSLVTSESAIPGSVARDHPQLGPRRVERIAYNVTNSDGSISYHDLYAWQARGHTYELFIVAETPDTYRSEIEAALSLPGLEPNSA